jgi:hypothetical protein
MQSGRKFDKKLPPNMPEPRGQSVTISAFVDTNHADNVITRRTYSAIFLFVQIDADALETSETRNAREESETTLN